jgi:ABC-type transporter Mla subunit MlaD
MIFAQFLKPIAAGLGITTLVLGIACGIMWWRIDALGETITALRGQVKNEHKVATDCAADMEKLRGEVDTSNQAIDAYKAAAAVSAGIKAESDRLARELARAESARAAIRAERDSFAAKLAVLPRCEQYATTLVALAGGAQ